MGQTEPSHIDWMQRRSSGIDKLTLKASSFHVRPWDQLHTEFDRERITAHLLLTIYRPHTCKLQEIHIGRDWCAFQRLELKGLEYKASCFSSLTILTLNSLAVEAGTLQVSSRSVCALLKDPAHNEYVNITEGEPCVLAGPFWVAKPEEFILQCIDMPRAC